MGINDNAMWAAAPGAADPNDPAQLTKAKNQPLSSGGMLPQPVGATPPTGGVKSAPMDPSNQTPMSVSSSPSEGVAPGGPIPYSAPPLQAAPPVSGVMNGGTPTLPVHQILGGGDNGAPNAAPQVQPVRMTSAPDLPPGAAPLNAHPSPDGSPMTISSSPTEGVPPLVPGVPTPGGYVPPGAPPSTEGSVLSGAPGSKEMGSLYDTLVKRANQSLHVDPNDPVIRDQTNAYEASQLRGERTGETQAAERGGSSANIDAQRRSGMEAASQHTAGFQASLMANEVAARRQEIQAALQGQQGILTADQQNALQEELAKMDVAMRNYQFGASQAQQESQFGRSQGQQESQFARDLAERGYEYDSTDAFRNSPLYGG